MYSLALLFAAFQLQPMCWEAIADTAQCHFRPKIQPLSHPGCIVTYMLRVEWNPNRDPLPRRRRQVFLRYRTDFPTRKRYR